MKTKMQIHNLIILDESGSMMSIKDYIIGGFNEILQTLKSLEKTFPQQEHFISFITFNGQGIKIIHFMEPLKNLGELNTSTYNPQSLTPLYDAMGLGMNMLENALSEDHYSNVTVTILTDGMENDSKEYTHKDIKTLIRKLQEKDWNIKYIGTDHNVQEVASSLSIKSHKVFHKDSIGIKHMVFKEKSDITDFLSELHKKLNEK